MCSSDLGLWAPFAAAMPGMAGMPSMAGAPGLGPMSGAAAAFNPFAAFGQAAIPGGFEMFFGQPALGPAFQYS